MSGTCGAIFPQKYASRGGVVLRCDKTADEPHSGMYSPHRAGLFMWGSGPDILTPPARSTGDPAPLA